MSSSVSAPTKEWLALIPDFPNSLDKRLKVRPDHLERIKPLIANNTIVMGGATLNKHPEVGEGPDMTGSFILVMADTKDEVMDLLKEDPYVKGGVWNLDAIQVWPFKSAVRKAL